MKKELFICECGSLEHQMMIWYDKEDDLLYTEVHLVTYHNFFKKFKYGLMYAFGRKCRFGAWDEFMFSKENVVKLQRFLNKLNTK